MKFLMNRNFTIDFETTLNELYFIHKDLKNRLMNDESFSEYFYFLLEFVYNNLLETNNLKDRFLIREQYSNLIAKEVNELYESEYIVVESNSTKNIIKDFISDNKVYFYIDDKTKQGVEFFIIKKHELETLNYLGLKDYFFINEKPLKFILTW